MKILKILGVVFLVVVILAIGAGTYIKTALPDTGETPVVTIERTPARIERGKYLANHVTVCMDCHSTRDYKYFAAPLAAGNFGGGGEVFSREMGFPGIFFATNITPYTLKSWTDGEILHAITTGVNKHGKALFPLMAWNRFGQMDKEDVYSIIAYIRTLPAVKNEVPPSEADFPVNFLLNTMPKPADFKSIPSPNELVKYGGYLVNAAGCVDCHSQTDKGTIIEGTEFSGGMEFKQPNGIMRSPNITFDKETGIGKWTEGTFVEKFTAYADPGYKKKELLPGELNSPMPWTMFGGMKPEDLKAIYAYLSSVKPIEHKVVKIEKVD